MLLHIRNCSSKKQLLRSELHSWLCFWSNEQTDDVSETAKNVRRNIFLSLTCKIMFLLLRLRLSLLLLGPDGLTSTYRTLLHSFLLFFCPGSHLCRHFVELLLPLKRIQISLFRRKPVSFFFWLRNAVVPWKTLGFYHVQIHHVLFTWARTLHSTPEGLGGQFVATYYAYWLEEQNHRYTVQKCPWPPHQE